MIHDLLNKISTSRLDNEETCVAQLIEAAKNIDYPHIKIAEIAKCYIERFRANTSNAGLEEFFRQYGLDTNEGMAVMSLAEALLRIPDAYTTNLFIHDKFSNVDWPNASGSIFSLASASSLGLKLASRLLESGKILSTMVDPIIRESIKQSMCLVSNHFVIGETTKDALLRAKSYEALGYNFSYDMLGEAARNADQAKRYFENYLRGVDEIAKNADITKRLYERPGISVKLSALYPKYKLINKEQVFDHLLPRLKAIALRAKLANIAVTIDAEESSRLDISLELFTNLVKDKELDGFNGIGIAVQAYNKSAIHVIDLICQLARTTNRKIPVRLVKGAYWDSEIKAAQLAGIANFPVFLHKEYSDISYLVCAHKMLQNSDIIYPQFATHNALTIASIQIMASNNNHKFEFQCLYGMGKDIYDQIIDQTPCRIYAPVGAHKELLPYLIRRIIENSANTSFLKKVIDNSVKVEELLDNPFLSFPQISTDNNLSKIKLPPDLYSSGRRNSFGFDFGNNSHLNEIKNGLAKFQNHNWSAAPIINGQEIKGNTQQILAPYNFNITVGNVIQSTTTDAQEALDATYGGFKTWSHTPVAKRIAIIKKFADLLEEHRFEIITLCTMEAGKIIADSLSELREAVDFCRYYACMAKEIFTSPKTMAGATGELNQLSLHGRGVFLCISPWNFPLSIFAGQVVAALLSGNTVIAKPAEQTPLIAALAIRLLLKAGLPKNAISLLPGDGELMGASLLSDQRIKGVAFTGGGETANIIQKSLAMRTGSIIPFIAETGGINSMIVDSSAHLEQAIDDIISSAFGSAGQRCSALRVLYVQDDIAGELLLTLKGAMEMLQLAMPADFATDIGPVIDSKSHKNLCDYIAMARKKYKLVAETTFNSGAGYFIAPIAFEINTINDLPGEIFGPVLHIIRFKAKNFVKVIEEVNNCGYGLTIGLHTRITRRIKHIRDYANIGNIYVNRSMIGATVGVQPFGGEGLSGTGPKAGGPNYLLRFATERSFTENTTAIGGNRELLT